MMQFHEDIMLVATDNGALMQGLLEPMLSAGDLRPLHDHLAEDAVLTVVPGETRLGASHHRGKAAVHEYFASLGDIVTFWRLTYGSSGARVMVVGEEGFTIQPGGLSADARFSLSVDLVDGLVTRLLLAWEAER
jgi:ketosteroid isomerase-like protein